jgi:hypothetical protein
VKVGRTAKIVAVAESLSSRMTDWWMERSTFEAQRSDRPVAPDRADNLHAPVAFDGGERGLPNGRVRRRSLYTWMALNPVRTIVTLSAIGVGLVAGARGMRRERRAAWRAPAHRPR